MNNREKGRAICKQFPVSRDKRDPKIDPCGTPGVIPSFDHLTPPFVFDISKNLLKDTTGFQICHYGEIL